tara:strand:- start:406 stop:534 length:129 start_codon:yes stop_codon:yes gene_type:complete
MGMSFPNNNKQRKDREMSIDELIEALLNGEDTSISIYWEDEE